jgi:hypothetical protein
MTIFNQAKTCVICWYFAANLDIGLTDLSEVSSSVLYLQDGSMYLSRHTGLSQLNYKSYNGA